MPSRYEPGVSARSTKRPITMSFKIRCAVDGCRPVAAARSLRLTGSDLDASVSSSFISRSMTWMAVFSRVVVDMTQSNIVIGRITPPYETAAKSLAWCGVAAAQGLPRYRAGRCCFAAVQGRAGIQNASSAIRDVSGRRHPAGDRVFRHQTARGRRLRGRRARKPDLLRPAGVQHRATAPRRAPLQRRCCASSKDSITWSFRAARAAGMYACITSSSSATIRT